MTVEMIFVGTELLLGNIVNTNAAFMAEKCAMLGLSCFYQTVVGDNEERLSGVVREALSRSDVIILSGGLGPTEDDLTKETVAKVLGLELFEDDNIKNDIKAFLEKRGYQITENNWKQAMVPKGAEVVRNGNGTAPGIIMTKENHHIILLPGPPNELIPMFNESIYPFLNELTPDTIVSSMVKVCGIGESLAETMLKDLIEQQDNPTIATYAKTGEVHIRVTAKASSEKEGRKLIKPVVKEIKSRFGASVYTTDESVTLEQSVVDLLKENELTMTTAESCTGGLLASRIVSVPGASDMFKEGLITYSNKAKRKYLGVRKSTLDKYGAVSEQTAKEMAKGGWGFTKSDVCVSITGIAGPDGGSDKKPVGLVYIGVSVCGNVMVREYRFSGNRSKIRETAASYALIQLREGLLNYFSENTFGAKKKK